MYLSVIIVTHYAIKTYGESGGIVPPVPIGYGRPPREFCMVMEVEFASQKRFADYTLMNIAF
jgi:hypothetical protein